MVNGTENLLAANMMEFGDASPLLRFVEPAAAAAAAAYRQELLGEIGRLASLACLDTKPHWGHLSPGCAICTRGEWSCLFINGICNGRCFYCPTSQTAKSEPMTNSIRFPNPQDYIDYLAAFGFRGASITGGEPLLTFDRTLLYVRKIKKRFGSKIHLWLYTNGILASEDKIGQLADAGLDEIRFDISADNYSLEHLALARGLIPVITVEIPAIPEDLQLLIDLLPRLAECGVSHLNLHHMRCTPHNLKHLVDRPYTLLPGPKVTVLESELTALKVLIAASRTGSGVAVNYCSYAYKSRFQGRAARMRAATRLVRPWEDITEAGYIRTLCLKGSDQALARAAESLSAGAGNSDRWRREKGGGLLFGQELWSLADVGGDLALEVSYATPRLQNAVSYRGSHEEIALNRKRTIVGERQTSLANRCLSPAAQKEFARLFLAGAGEAGGSAPANVSGMPGGIGTEFSDLLAFERLAAGLSRYC